MKGVRRDSFGPPTKGLAEQNHYSMRDDRSGVRDGITSEVNGLSVEEELRINEDAEGENEIRRNLVRVQPVLHTHQQQPQGSLVCWDQFLPFRSLKILLVENDDSTRHVVSALLRNCSYQVTAVANGLAAWKILEDLTNHVDLVLTEVAMPYFSGIGLLSKIMNHKSRKNVPVIMMSSNDSMGIVFKCLSRGALDFLVKPIRKNELKNLWQHVWRKCHSSSGSGSGSASESESESGIRTQKSTKFRSVEGSENSTDSNNQADEAENGSIGLNMRDESENGSGTQGSWSKRAVEVDSPQRMSPDSTCAQVIHSRLEAPSANWVPTLSTRECHNEEDELGNAGMGKDLTIGGPRIPDLQLEGPTSKEVDGLAGSKKDKRLELDPNGNEKIDGNLQLNKETWKDGLKNKDAGHKAAITNTCNPQLESTANEVANDAIYDAKDIPSLELSLKQLRDVEDTGTSVQESKLLRHSDLSAFSRYNAASTAKQTPTGNVGSCSPFNNSSEGGKTESMHNLRTNSSSVPNQHLNRSSNNNDMGSSTNNVSVKPETLTDKPITKSVVNVHPCSSFQPVQHGHNSNSSSPPMLSEKAGSAKAALAQEQAMHQKVQVQHHHHHYHHYHHHVHNSQQQQNASSERNLGVASHLGTSDMLGTPVEGNASNYESASGSNNGSNGQIGSSGQHRSSSVIIAGGTNIVTENGASEKSAVGSGNGTATDPDQNRSAEREAALHKFRQKRKERCFEKKVRYESRKRLAEERPRVRGQFVRQAADKSKSNDTNC